MGCCFGKNKTEDEQEINTSESLRQSLITKWDQLTAPGGEPDSLCNHPYGDINQDNPHDVDSSFLADPPSPRSYRIRRRSVNKNKHRQHRDNKKWAAGVPKSVSTYMDC